MTSPLQYSAECVNKHGLKHEAVITMMITTWLCWCSTVDFYENILKQILDAGMKLPLCFKDK